MFTRVNMHCDCCGQAIAPEVESDCPNCGYPIAPKKERLFLQSAIRDLQRVATHGGASMTVTDLLHRYQTRLNDLKMLEQPQPTPIASVPIALASAPMLMATASSPAPQPTPAPIASSPKHDEHIHHVFSWKTFFANQTINIVASLGAFFILIGSLSFIATTTNLFLSFMVMLLVHAIFGIIGMVSYRFQAFRTVSVIYTAIFALLVPLVGFSAYRVVEGQMIPLSTSTLVVIAATYAALVYGFLAVYQRFAPFGYLAVSALLLADLALSQALHLSYPWWIAMLFVLALPALLAAPRPTSVWPFSGLFAILRAPVQILMYLVVSVSAFGLLFTYLFTMSVNGTAQPTMEARLAMLTVASLLLLWTTLYCWLTRQKQWAVAIPYLLLVVVLFFCYALDFTALGYAIALTVLALSYHLLKRVAYPLPQLLEQTATHIEGIALILVGIVPLLLMQSSPLVLLLRSFGFPSPPQLMAYDTIIRLALQAVGLAITCSILFSHTGLKRIISPHSVSWLSLLLLAGWQLDMGYALAVAQLRLSPFNAFLTLTLLLVVSAVLIRRFINSTWSNMFDIVTLANIAITLIFSLGQQHAVIAGTLLGFAALTYALVVYQQRTHLLFLPLVFFSLALPLLSDEFIGTTLMLAILFPLGAMMTRLSITNRRERSTVLTFAGNSTRPAQAISSDEQATLAVSPRPSAQNPLRTLSLAWEWPLLAAGMTLGALIIIHDLSTFSSVLRQGFGLAWPSEIELGGLALAWYVAAGIAQRTWWLVATYTLIVVAMFLTVIFWTFAWAAPLALLAALLIRRRVGRAWAYPLYATSLLAAVSIGYHGFEEPYRLFALWELAAYALLVYTAGVIEEQTAFQWLSPVFAAWSATIAIFYGQQVFAFGLGVFFVGLGIATLLLKRIAPSVEERRRHFVLPLYGNTLAVAAILVLYGIVVDRTQLNQPFYDALPLAVLLYAALAFAVSVLEQRPAWLWFTPLLGLTAVIFLPSTITCFTSNGYDANLCYTQLQTTTALLVGIALATGIVGILVGRLLHTTTTQHTDHPLQDLYAHFTWSWPWYILSYGTILVILSWSENTGALILHGTPYYEAMLASFIVLACIEMLLERTPEAIVLPMLLTSWLIAILPWTLWQQMLAYSALCVAVFGAQFIWLWLPSHTTLITPKRLYAWLAIGGQTLVVLAIAWLSGFSTSEVAMAHTGSGALLILAVLLFWNGSLQPTQVVRHWYNYSSGLLIALSISWELLAQQQTGIDVLTIAPASYLIVIAPFLSRDQHLANRHLVGQLCAITGSLLLLLPTFWLSFTHDNLQPTLVLVGESLALLLLGIVTHMRFFVLSGAALVIVATIHALFLPELGIPLSLALALLGAILLTLATVLSLMRQRLRLVWSELE